MEIGAQTSSTLAGLSTMRADEPERLRVTTLDRRTGVEPLNFELRERGMIPAEDRAELWRPDREMFILPDTRAALNTRLILRAGRSPSARCHVRAPPSGRSTRRA